MIDLQKYLKWIVLGLILFLAACSKDSDEALVLPASLSFVENTTTGMFNFVKNHAGTIQGAKVLAPESLNSNYACTDLILNDAVAMENLNIVGGHLYGSGFASYSLAEQKGKEIWMTEFAFVIVCAKAGEPGEIKVKAKSAGLKEAVVEIRSKLEI